MKELNEVTKQTDTEESATMPENSTETEESVIRSRFASDVGGRTGNRLTKLFDRAAGLFGIQDKAASDQTGKPNLPTPTNRKTGLGRGGWTAIGVLLIMLPLFIALLLWVIDINTQLQGYKYNLEQVQKGANVVERESALVHIMNSPKLQSYELKSTDPIPVGNIHLHVADYKEWALTFQGLLSTDQNNVYAIWLVQYPANNAQPRAQDYYYLSSFVSQAGGHYIVINESSFPSNFAYSTFNRLIVTEEPGAKGKPSSPGGPIRFVLDLSQVKIS